MVPYQGAGAAVGIDVLLIVSLPPLIHPELFSGRIHLCIPPYTSFHPLLHRISGSYNDHIQSNSRPPRSQSFQSLYTSRSPLHSPIARI